MINLVLYSRNVESELMSSSKRQDYVTEIYILKTRPFCINIPLITYSDLYVETNIRNQTFPPFQPSIDVKRK